MTDKVGTGKFTNTHSVPCSAVTQQVDVKSFLQNTPIPKMEPKNWVQGAPMPVKEGSMTPNTEALNLLTGFATGHITVEEGQLKHLPTNNIGNPQKKERCQWWDHMH